MRKKGGESLELVQTSQSPPYKLDLDIYCCSEAHATFLAKGFFAALLLPRRVN